MRGLLGAALLALVLAPGALSAQRAGDPRRAALQAQILDRFMDRVSQRLQLDGGQRTRLEQVLRANETRRRELQRDAGALRRRLADAIRDPATRPGEFEHLLDGMADLRTRDARLWRDEQAALAQVLNPRQRAEFVGLRVQFYEMVQRLRRERGGPGGPPGRGPGMSPGGGPPGGGPGPGAFLTPTLPPSP